MHLTERNKELIRKYIAGEYSSEEWQEIKQLMSDPTVHKIFEEVLEEKWSGLEPERNFDQPELNQQLQSFYSRLEEQKSDPILKESNLKESDRPVFRLSDYKNFYKYAAVWIVFLLGASIYALSYFKGQKQELSSAQREFINPRGQRSKIILQDSTIIFLGADSKLISPKVFTATSREVYLEGAAFFEVKKNPKKPFIIHTGTIQTKVLGTSFKIEAIKGRPVVVAVATGKVSVEDVFKTGRKHLALLLPGDLLTYNHRQVVKTSTDIEELQSWTGGKVSFHNESLQKITDELERWYDIKVSYQDAHKANEKVSITLKMNMPLQQILKVLAVTAHFNFKLSDRHVTIN